MELFKKLKQRISDLESENYTILERFKELRAREEFTLNHKPKYSVGDKVCGCVIKRVELDCSVYRYGSNVSYSYFYAYPLKNIETDNYLVGKYSEEEIEGLIAKSKKSKK